MCQLSSKLHLLHRDSGRKFLEKSVYFFFFFFWILVVLTKKGFDEFPFNSLFGTDLCCQERYHYHFSCEATEMSNFAQGPIRLCGLFSRPHHIILSELQQVTLCL